MGLMSRDPLQSGDCMSSMFIWMLTHNCRGCHYCSVIPTCKCYHVALNLTKKGRWLPLLSCNFQISSITRHGRCLEHHAAHCLQHHGPGQHCPTALKMLVSTFQIAHVQTFRVFLMAGQLQHVLRLSFLSDNHWDVTCNLKSHIQSNLEIWAPRACLRGVQAAVHLSIRRFSLAKARVCETIC